MKALRRSDAPDISFRDVGMKSLWPLWLVSGYVLWYVVHYYPQRHWVGADAHAYWLTAHHDKLYSIPAGMPDAFNYSPAFAQVIHPLALLPWPVFAALWMALEAAAFAWLLAPLGWKWGVPFWLCCSLEVGFGNMWGLLTVAVVVALTRPAAWAVVALSKITPCVGILWHVTRREWRSIAIAALSVGTVTALSVAIDPSAWTQWYHYLRANRGVADLLWLRIAVAAVLIVVAARNPRRRWLLAPALILSSPHLFGWQWITCLAGIPRLVLGGRSSATQQAPHARRPDRASV